MKVVQLHEYTPNQFSNPTPTPKIAPKNPKTETSLLLADFMSSERGKDVRYLGQVIQIYFTLYTVLLRNKK